MKLPVKFGAIAVALACSTAAFAQDAKNGETIFNRQCKVCHQVGPNAKTAVGPIQNGVVGSKAGARSGYTYSKAMIDAGVGGLTWTEDNLGKYLENPKGIVLGTKMVYPGLKKPEERADVIAYLKTFPTQ